MGAAGQSFTDNKDAEIGGSVVDLNKPKSLVKTNWIRCGLVGFACQCSDYPSVCASGFLQIVCLSKQHMVLIFLFALGSLILALEVFRLVMTIVNRPEDITDADQNTEVLLRSLSVS